MITYDVIIIGGGISGLFSAYKIQKLCPDKSILIYFLLGEIS
jgi:L-2-hydroxyglutarate oxidase LhgO